MYTCIYIYIYTYIYTYICTYVFVCICVYTCTYTCTHNLYTRIHIYPYTRTLILYPNTNWESKNFHKCPKEGVPDIRECLKKKTILLSKIPEFHQKEPYIPSSSALHSAAKKKNAYSIKRAPRCTTRALYPTKRTLYSIKRAIYPINIPSKFHWSTIGNCTMLQPKSAQHWVLQKWGSLTSLESRNFSISWFLATLANPNVSGVWSSVLKWRR